MKFIFSFAVFFLFLNCLVTAQTLIQNGCKKSAAKDPKCVQYLEKNPQSKNATNLKEMVIASTKNASSELPKVKSIAVEILKDKNLKPGIKLPLRDCVEFYDDANDSLNDTLRFVNLGEYKSAVSALSTALDVPVNCEDGFKEFDTKSPISKEDNVLFQLISIALNYAVMLK
ncbi:hypothetical protein Bca52824_005448 [Brassica carinata]|uniref:Pectinesterase inhibitor domain-containing protein n=1 Tax=Brassica carinata TaxID=52824 RepID=A0A8X8BGZ5_BRACI|nr:hypothetical protein Bca52824_005448 [Brassica carinata]